MNTTHAAAFLLVLCSACLGQETPQRLRQVPPPSVIPEIVNPEKPYPLMVGDPAPQFVMKDWILGDPIDRFEPGKVYLIHLWATWCDPCLGAMRRLTELQNLHEKDGLVVIGATSPGMTNTREVVERYVFDPRHPVGFPIAWDGRRATFDFWLYPAGRAGIPCLFIVDREGRVAFIGGLAEFEKPLGEILAGTFDLDAAMRQYYECITAGQQFLAFERRLKEKDVASASVLGREIVRDRGSNCFGVLSNIAWTIVDPAKPYDFPDYDLALEAAKRANHLTGGRDAETLDTLARAHFLKGDADTAAAVQARAVELATTEESKKRFSRALDEYRAAAPR